MIYYLIFISGLLLVLFVYFHGESWDTLVPVVFSVGCSLEACGINPRKQAARDVTW